MASSSVWTGSEPELVGTDGDGGATSTEWEVVPQVRSSLWMNLIFHPRLGRAKGDAPKVTEPNLRFPAVFCENLRFPAKICGFLRFPDALQMLEFPGENLRFGLSLSP